MITTCLFLWRMVEKHVDFLMKYVCPKCGKNIELGAEALIASEYRTVCPQCLSQLEIVGDYAYIQPEGDPLQFSRPGDESAANETAVTPPPFSPVPPALPARDPLYDSAVEFVSRCNAITPFMLRDYFDIDLERAHELMAQLEQNGIVGPANGGAPRQILIPHNTNIPLGLPVSFGRPMEGQDADEQPIDDTSRRSVHVVNCGGCLMWALLIMLAIALLRHFL